MRRSDKWEPANFLTHSLLVSDEDTIEMPPTLADVEDIPQCIFDEGAECLENGRTVAIPCALEDAAEVALRMQRACRFRVHAWWNAGNCESVHFEMAGSNETRFDAAVIAALKANGVKHPDIHARKPPVGNGADLSDEIQALGGTVREMVATIYERMNHGTPGNA